MVCVAEGASPVHAMSTLALEWSRALRGKTGGGELIARRWRCGVDGRYYEEAERERGEAP